MMKIITKDKYIIKPVQEKHNVPTIMMISFYTQRKARRKKLNKMKEFFV